MAGEQFFAAIPYFLTNIFKPIISRHFHAGANKGRLIIVVCVTSVLAAYC